MDDVRVEFQREGTVLKGRESKPPAFTLAVIRYLEINPAGNGIKHHFKVGVSFRSKEDEDSFRGRILALTRAFKASSIGLQPFQPAIKIG